MSDKANCKNCIHFDEIKRRCCLNDDSLVQKECYFRRNNKKPIGNDIIFEKQGNIIKDLQQQLDQQKAMWQKLKEFIIKKQEEYQAGIIEQGMQGSIPNSISFYVRYNLCNEIQKKIQELEAEDE